MLFQLISQESNTGVQYEYYLPLQGQALGYSWSYGSWSECSSECGGGKGRGLDPWWLVWDLYPHPAGSVTVCCPLQQLPSSLLLETSTRIQSVAKVLSRESQAWCHNRIVVHAFFLFSLP